MRNEATQKQVDAADPTGSVWLSANAGSGKTRVLTDRVARLLLDRVSPQNILCLTYTKAAASEMQNRLFARLGSWAMMDDGALRDELSELGVEAALSAPDLDRARTLFAAAIETPGGLRIQTIHSFCAALLRKFPLEAGVSPQFAEMDDRTTQLLRDHVLEEMSVETPQLVLDLARFAAEETLDGLVRAIVDARATFARWPGEAGLKSFLDLAPDATPGGLIAQTFTPGDMTTIASVVRICETGSKTEMGVAAKLRDISEPFTLAQMALLEGALLTGATAKAPFSAKTGGVMVKATRSQHPELGDDLDDLMARIEAARPTRLALAAYERTRVLYAFAMDFLRRYEAAKLARGQLDFDDLIMKARSLLSDSVVTQWVLFRLDGGIDHILVDEAQDTSPVQWDVVQALAAEFSAGVGANPDRKRTLFVVGDKKQSIYSFQGADPDGFDRMRDHFEDRFREASEPFQALGLEYSFRSAQAILSTVDVVFRGPHRHDIDWDPALHRAFKDTMPGRVDLWPALVKEKEPDVPFDWTAPVDVKSPEDVTFKLARSIAEKVKELVTIEYLPIWNKDTGAYERRQVTEGDILILVQRRSALFDEIIRACKKEKLNIAGSDRLKVGAELAVKDILSVLRFLALPEDDLSLAEALKSPLFAWSEQDLYALAQPRPDKSYLWQALRDSEDHPRTLTVLQDLRKQVDFLRPYDLINRLLTRHNGRTALLSRLGPEAEDGIDALLGQALDYEAHNVPGLTGFLEWAQADDLTIKRQMDGGADEIRVMSVHGAKGLEAPIVILPDTTKRKPQGHTLLTGGDLVLWPPAQAERPEPIARLHGEQQAADMRERLRLLYVAMTRAENWLIVAGVGDAGSGTDSWHSLIDEGLAHQPSADLETPWGMGRRVETGDWGAGEFTAAADRTDDKTTLPTFHRVTDTPEQIKPRSPSDLGGAKVIAGETRDEDAEVSKLRGTFVHVLLEHLPLVVADARHDIGHRLLAADARRGQIPNAQALIADAITLIDTPDLRAIFAPDVLTEVEISATLPEIGPVAGAIDRLRITDTTVTIIDYKTNRLTPDSPEKTPDGLLRQMGAYGAMAARIWPDKQIETQILWTATATLMTIPQTLRHAALGRVNEVS